jgi:methionyl-tRNA formyltransferase
MQVAFAGTPGFARVALCQLFESGFGIPLVLTQPDRPAGRGMHLQASPVKEFSLGHGLALMQPKGLGERFADDARAVRDALLALQIDVLVVAAYGLLLPSWLLELPRWGCLNIHASLLPRWRGAAPIQRAIEAGDEMTGITIMQMDAGLDTGDIRMMESLPIDAADTSATLHDKLAALGGRMIVEALRQLEAGQLPRSAQPQAGVTYASKIGRHEAAIQWASPALQILRRVRAFDPFPGATTRCAGATLKVWAAEMAANPVPSGTPSGAVLEVAADGVVVAAQDGALRLTQLQRPGGRRLGAAEFLRGFAIVPGMLLQD